MWCPGAVSHKAEERDKPLLSLLPVVQPRVHSAFWAAVHSAAVPSVTHQHPSHFLQGCSQPTHLPSWAAAGGGPAISSACWSQNRSVLSSFHALAMPNILTPGTDRASLCPLGGRAAAGRAARAERAPAPQAPDSRAGCRGQPPVPTDPPSPGQDPLLPPDPCGPCSDVPAGGCYGARGHPSPSAAPGPLERQQRGAGGRALCLACLTSCPLPWNKVSPAEIEPLGLPKRGPAAWLSQECLPGHLPPLQPRRGAEELVELDEEQRAGDVPPLLPRQGGTGSQGCCGRAGREDAAAESL